MTMTPKGQIAREGRVSFGDASLSVWEEGLANARAAGGWAAENAWERQFRKDVFLRIVQLLNRLGWTCKVPQEYIKQYSLDFARSRRECSKGDLRGWLDLSGRHIEFQMWQGVNTPTRPDHGGRYESNKEAVAPYLLRLEMIRTRNRIRDYLCNVFSGYYFDPPRIDSANPDPLAYFNDSWDGEYEKKRGVHRFNRGADGWPDYETVLQSWDRKDRDGNLLRHGDVRCVRNHKGHLLRGRVYGGINGMWLFVYGPGRKDFSHHSHGEFFTYQAGEPVRKVSARRRRSRLEGELSAALKTMNYERAAVVRDILFPKAEPLFVVWHKEHKAYHCANFQGYTTDVDDAGKFTKDELKGYTSEPNEVRPLEAA